MKAIDQLYSTVSWVSIDVMKSAIFYCFGLVSLLMFGSVGLAVKDSLER